VEATESDAVVMKKIVDMFRLRSFLKILEEVFFRKQAIHIGILLEDVRLSDLRLTNL